jgi:hypothetical protein
MVRRAKRARRAPLAGLRSAWAPMRRRLLRSDGFLLLTLSALALLVGWGALTFPRWVPLSLLSVTILIAGVSLRVRSLLLLYAVVAAVAAFALSRSQAPFGVNLVIAVTAVIVLLLARSRARLGVLGTRGESMLVDLRDRLRAQGEMPPLPGGWAAEVVMRSANGASFSGDFLVATKSTDGKTLEVALVDVSGKGMDAGARALLLSGSFGGLLGAMPREQFLPAANQYLLRQDWDEGFATAAHLVVDLTTGDYTVTTAGHPPAAQFISGSGRWQTAELTEGPLLGVMLDARYTGESGRLDRGDALLLYTDGLIEIPGRDLAEGIDKLLGQAERLVTRGFRHGARRLIDAVASGEGDDRALVLIWRT